MPGFPRYGHIYREGDIVGEYPMYIEFKGEMAIDGDVLRFLGEGI
jgi:predicted RNA-binding protein